jgi:hypothetical protein
MATSPARQQFRELLAQLAGKTQQKLPQLNGRVEKATRLVLAGDVELHTDGTALVHSLSEPTKAYQLKDGICQCRDWQQAPNNLCCHRLAVGFARKIEEVFPAQSTNAETEPLYEAPSSVNVRALVAGHEVQWTLRDRDENHLAERLQRLLARKDVQPLPKPAPRSKPHGASQNGHQHIRRDFR